MIQRKQTLFLFELVFLAIALMFIPAQYASTGADRVGIMLVPVEHEGLQSTAGHQAAIALNFAGLVLAFFTIFLYSRRELQVKLSYAQMLLWTVLTLMFVLCPFTEIAAETGIEVNYLAVAIGIFGILAAFLAAHFIKKDIELLKSADRIR